MHWEWDPLNHENATFHLSFISASSANVFNARLMNCRLFAGGALFHHGFDPFNIHLNGNLAIASMNGNSRNFPPGPFAAGNTQNPQLLYWHYPSPPISPNNYFGGMQTNGIHLQALNGHLSPSVHSFQHQLLTAASYNVIKVSFSFNVEFLSLTFIK